MGGWRDRGKGGRRETVGAAAVGVAPGIAGVGIGPVGSVTVRSSDSPGAEDQLATDPAQQRANRLDVETSDRQGADRRTSSSRARNRSASARALRSVRLASARADSRRASPREAAVAPWTDSYDRAAWMRSSRRLSAAWASAKSGADLGRGAGVGQADAQDEEPQPLPIDDRLELVAGLATVGPRSERSTASTPRRASADQAGLAARARSSDLRLRPPSHGRRVSTTRYWSVASIRRRLRSPVRYSPDDGGRFNGRQPRRPRVMRRTASVRIRSRRSIPTG